jgi:hypothetical protein
MTATRADFASRSAAPRHSVRRRSCDDHTGDSGRHLHAPVLASHWAQRRVGRRQRQADPQHDRTDQDALEIWDALPAEGSPRNARDCRPHPEGRTFIFYLCSTTKTAGMLSGIGALSSHELHRLQLDRRSSGGVRPCSDAASGRQTASPGNLRSRRADPGRPHRIESHSDVLRA